MASVFPKTIVSKKTGKTNTKWYVGYYQDGKHRSKSAGDSKTVALKLKKRIEAELETGKYEFLSQPSSVRIDHSISQFLEQTKQLRKLRSFMRYRNALDHLRSFLDYRHPNLIVVSKLAQSHFIEYQSWRRSQEIFANGHNGAAKAPTFKTINVELAIYRTWLNWALQSGQVRQNPLSGWKSLKTTDSKARRVLTREEFQKLLQASQIIEKERPERKGQSRIWRFLVNTGLRIDELIHLQWKDINWSRGVILVQRKSFWDPKTYGREVPFTPTSETILKELRTSGTKAEDFVFLSPRSQKQLRQTVIRRWLLDCGQNAEIDGLRGPHDLRHTFITWGLTEFGIDIPTMQKIAGHRHLETTQIYVHPTTSHAKLAMKRFGQSPK